MHYSNFQFEEFKFSIFRNCNGSLILFNINLFICEINLVQLMEKQFGDYFNLFMMMSS